MSKAKGKKTVTVYCVGLLDVQKGRPRYINMAILPGTDAPVDCYTFVVAQASGVSLRAATSTLFGKLARGRFYWVLRELMTHDSMHRDQADAVLKKVLLAGRT